MVDDGLLLRVTKSGNFEEVKKLLDDGADMDVRDSNGRTPLMCASKHGNRKIVELLLDRCADISPVNKYHDRTCLYYNRCIWRLEYIQELIINKQPHNIKFFDDKIGILPELKEKHKDVIELVEMGIF